MKKVLALCMAIVMCLGLCSCSSKETHYDVSEYILELPYKEDFRILQLCDIHLGNKDDREKHYNFIDLTINDADADLIVLNGDLFTFADKTTAKELFAWIDSYGIPWAVTFGNHDEQCYFSIDWLTDYLNNFGSNCVFKDIQGDDVFGYCNYAINLTENGKVVEQIILMDSNRYNYEGEWGYDYFKEDQIQWYEDLVNYTTSQNGGKVVPSVMYYHIPVQEFQEAWDKSQAGDSDAVYEYGQMGENVSAPKVNTGMFDKALSLGSTSAMCCAHDHINNFRVLYKGIYCCYGVNSDDRIYYDEDMMGGFVVTVHSDNTLGFDYIYHKYEEVQ